MPVLDKQKEIIVVSGLPRSGTSLMMQMLQAGGLPLYYDASRPADVHNPKGYFELEAVKNLPHNSLWLKQASGKAVKIISHLIQTLPPQFYYRVIFMRRDLREVILSQNKMLLRMGKPLGALEEHELIARYQEHLNQVIHWLNTRKNMVMLQVPYEQLIKEPEHQADLIVKFLDQPLDVSKMIEQVEPALQRIKLT